MHIWHGDQDRNVVVESGTYLANEIPLATMRRLPGDGHWLVHTHFADILGSIAA